MRSFLNTHKLWISNFLVCGIASTIPFMINVGNIFIIVSSVWTAVYLLLERGKNLKLPKDVKLLILISFIYFFYILGSALASYDVKSGLKMVDRSLFFLLIPFIIFGLNQAIDAKKVFRSYLGFTALASLICIISAIIRSLIHSDVGYLFFDNFSSVLDQHPIYFSYYIVMSLLISYTKKDIVPKSFNLIARVILIVSLILTSSKISIVLFFVFLLFYSLYDKKQLQFKSLVVVLLFLISVVFILRERFVSNLSFDLGFTPTQLVEEAKVFTSQDKDGISDLELRYVFGSIALFHIFQEDKLLFGYGVGDVQDYLDYHFMFYNLAPSWYEGYNAHNQYVQFVINGGIVLLLLILIYLSGMIKIALRRKNLLMLLFLLFILNIFLFESVLQRVKGIIFFVFFCNIFLTESIKHESSDIR